MKVNMVGYKPGDFKIPPPMKIEGLRELWNRCHSTEETHMKLYKKDGRRYVQITRAEIVAEGLDILRSSPRVKGYVKDVEIAMLMGHVVITEPEDPAPTVQDGHGR